MPRFILIDNSSGYIFGDTGNLPAHTFAEDDHPISQSSLTPMQAARWVDEAEVRVHGRRYEEVAQLAANETGYRVFRADIDGSDAVTVVTDGQSQAAIGEVERCCRLVAIVRCTDAIDAS